MNSDYEDDVDPYQGPDDGERPADWQRITENIYLVDNGRTKNGRLDRKMRCDCELEYDDEGKPLMGCGEDCINRLLMIECHPKTCPCGEFCGNLRFQKKQYSQVEMFDTRGPKGWGLRAMDPLDGGAFVCEYVGEVCSQAEFQRRAEDYHEEGRRHHYFMTLRGDQVIDATRKGSISRFMNHSCEPNCETQKWTVNGRLRVGFFTKRRLEEDEELTFDYQFERIGEGAQECHCGAPSCSGYIGGKQQKGDRSSAPTGRFSKKPRSPSVVEDELTRTVRQCCPHGQGLVYEEDVLSLSRVMVTADSVEHRLIVLDVLLATENEKCLRVFVKLQGLSLLWSWMIDADSCDGDPIALRILEALEHLPIANRNILKDSKVLSQVTRWSALKSAAKESVPTGVPRTAEVASSAASVDATRTLGETTFSEEVCTGDERQQPDSALPEEADTTLSGSDSGVESPASTFEQNGSVDMADDVNALKQKAVDLLEKWSGLKEVYRIPKKVAKSSAYAPTVDTPTSPSGCRSPAGHHIADLNQTKDKLSAVEKERLLCTVREQRQQMQRLRQRTLTPGGLSSRPSPISSGHHTPRSAPPAPLSLPCVAGVSSKALSLGNVSVVPPVIGAVASAAGILPPPILFTNLAGSLLSPGMLAATASGPQTPSRVSSMPPGQFQVTPQGSVQSMTPTSWQNAGQSPQQSRPLPANWMSAQDAEGRTYYYHIERRESQWFFPSEELMGDETPPLPTEPPMDDGSHTPDETPPASDGTPSPNSNLFTGMTATFSPMQDKRSYSRISVPEFSSPGSRTPKASSSIRTVNLTSTEKRQVKDSFRSDLSKLIVQLLNPYRKADCRRGRIENDDDFKHLARKLTFIVVEKELRRKSCCQLEYSPSVRAKTQDFVQSYMTRFHDKYIRS